MPAPGTLTQSAQDGAGPAGRSEGGRPTHWLVPLLYEAAERIRTDADHGSARQARDQKAIGDAVYARVTASTATTDSVSATVKISVR